MTKLFIYIGFLTFLLPRLTFSQVNKLEQHPIDNELTRCLSIDSNQTTLGMIQCESIAHEKWNIEMDKYYDLLVGKLSPIEKEKLAYAQKLWLEYKGSELDFEGTMYYNMQGTMWRVVAAERARQIIKTRALELKEYYETITFDNAEN